MEGLGECWKSVREKKVSVRCRFFSTLLFLSGSCRVEGTAGPCGRSQGSLDHVYSAGGSHRGCSKIQKYLRCGNMYQVLHHMVLLCVLWGDESTFHSFFFYFLLGCS